MENKPQEDIAVRKEREIEEMMCAIRVAHPGKTQEEWRQMAEEGWAWQEANPWTPPSTEEKNLNAPNVEQPTSEPFEIVQGVKPPTTRMDGGNMSRLRSTIEKLKAGDSFLFPSGELAENTIRNTTSQAAKSLGYSITTRKEKGGFRIWRLTTLAFLLFASTSMAENFMPPVFEAAPESWYPAINVPHGTEKQMVRYVYEQLFPEYKAKLHGNFAVVNETENLCLAGQYFKPDSWESEGRIVMHTKSGSKDYSQTLCHEMAHAFNAEIRTQQNCDHQNISTEEGMAEAVASIINHDHFWEVTGGVYPHEFDEFNSPQELKEFYKKALFAEPFPGANSYIRYEFFILRILRETWKPGQNADFMFWAIYCKHKDADEWMERLDAAIVSHGGTPEAFWTQLYNDAKQIK